MEHSMSERLAQLEALKTEARNEQLEKSDIDLLVDFEPDQENFDNYMAIYDIFEKVFKNEKIEMVTKNGLSPYIGPKILNEVVYV